MCFYIHDNHRVPYIAPKDFYVFKVLNKQTKFKVEQIASPYLSSFKWKIGVEYSEPKFHSCAEKSVNHGFHAFVPGRVLLHNFDTIASNDVSSVIGLCKVPKGATVYFNPEKEQVCSNKMQLVETYDLNELRKVCQYESAQKWTWILKFRPWSYEKKANKIISKLKSAKL